MFNIIPEKVLDTLSKVSILQVILLREHYYSGGPQLCGYSFCQQPLVSFGNCNINNNVINILDTKQLLQDLRIVLVAAHLTEFLFEVK